MRFPNEYRTCQVNLTSHYEYALLKLDRKVIRKEYIELGLDYVSCEEPLALFGYRDCGYSTADQKRILEE
jgi:hypothetical protein